MSDNSLEIHDHKKKKTERSEKDKEKKKRKKEKKKKKEKEKEDKGIKCICGRFIHRAPLRRDNLIFKKYSFQVITHWIRIF